jgi:arylsulfatase A-like enzyme
LFTGLYLTQHGTTFAHQALDPGLPALAEILAAEGYRTAAFSENPNIARSNGFGRGFGDFEEPFLYGRAAIMPALLDKVLTRFAGHDPSGEYTEDTLGGLERWIRAGSLKNGSSPFFAFVNLMAAHLPDWPRRGFSPPAADRALLRRLRPINRASELNFLPSYALTGAEMDALRGFYGGDVAYLDFRLEGLFRFLESSGILDGTVLVITSDHGENFGEHGLIEHAYCLYNTVLHVPLIVRYPALIPAGAVRMEPVSTIGLFGTLLDLAGVPESRRPAEAPRIPLLKTEMGGDVFAESENCAGMIRSVISQEKEAAGFDYRPFDRAFSCIYSGDRKLILDSNGRVELYSLSGDWDERNEISAAEPATVERLLGKLASWRSGLKRPAPPAPEPRLPRGVKDALKSLGYIR